ncbi:MAG: SDR family oxidoreductase [Microthrixaceae bacterium]
MSQHDPAGPGTGEGAADQLDHHGRVVLVTGGTKGIGAVLVRRFLDWGAEVMTCGRSEPESLPTARGRSAAFTVADVRDPEQAAALVDGTVERFGRIDAVINNAGGAPPADAATASPRFSESIVRLNLLAAARRPAGQPPHATGRRRRDREHLVCVRDAALARNGRLRRGQGRPVEPDRLARGRVGPEGARVAIVAGLIETEQAELHYGDEEAVARVAATVPAGRLGTPEDLAQACRWLTSPLSDYMSGTAVWLHGGGERPAFLDAAGG